MPIAQLLPIGAPVLVGPGHENRFEFLRGGFADAPTAGQPRSATSFRRLHSSCGVTSALFATSWRPKQRTHGPTRRSLGYSGMHNHVRLEAINDHAEAFTGGSARLFAIF